MRYGERQLRGITWDHIRGYGPLNASILPYKKETSIQVFWEKRSLKDFGDTSLEKLARAYDLIIVDHPHAGMASETRCIVPLDEVLHPDILLAASTNSVGPSFISYTYNNHQWALPIDAACQVSCKRQDLLRDLPLPQHWNDVFRLADQLKSNKLSIGMALCPTDCNCSFLTLCAQLGDPVEEDKFTTTTTGQKALTILQRLYVTSHPESSTWNPIRLYDFMVSTNEVAYSPLAFGYTNYARENYALKQLHYGAIPGKHHALLGGAGIAVSAYRDFIPEAAAYAAWLCSEKYQSTTYVDAGGQPAHKTAWTNEKANGITGRFFAETLATMEAAYVRPRNLHWPLFQEELGEIIHEGLVKNITAAKIWNRIIDVYQRYYGNGLRFEV
jgi:multiple sugar transport system substrate-binding protein